MLLSLTCMGWSSGTSVCVYAPDYWDESGQGSGALHPGHNFSHLRAQMVGMPQLSNAENTFTCTPACMHRPAHAGHPLWEALTSAVTLTGRWRSSKFLITLANYMISRIDRRDVQPSQAMGAHRRWWRIRAGLPLQAAMCPNNHQ